MREEILIAGFGGQGVLSLGWLVSTAAMLDGKEVTWLPAYGPAQRGGKANCTVIISDEDIGSPITRTPSTQVIMNRPSLEFAEAVIPGGLVLINQSLVQWDESRDDLKVLQIDATNEAKKLGNGRVANVIILGAYVAAKGVISKNSVTAALKDIFGSKQQLKELNQAAFDAGYNLAREVAWVASFLDGK